jgi:hypothetical protein
MNNEIVGDNMDEIVGDQLVGDGFEGDYGNEYGSEFGDDGMGDQLVGAGEFGEDGYGADEAGATQRRRRMVRHHRMHRPQPSARQQAIHAHRLRSSRAVVSKGYTKSRVQSIGFESLQIAPHSSADIPTKPQVLFRGTRLIVGSAIAQFFTIDDIKVGRTSQFVATGSQPAEAFKETATGENVSLDTCRPGMDIVLQVTNISDTAQDFRAALFGDAVE